MSVTCIIGLPTTLTDPQLKSKVDKIDIMVPEVIERRILLIRGQKVMLDSHLAELYGVENKALKPAVRRNKERFPEDFIFQLTKQEDEILRSHFGTLRWGEHPNIFLMFLPNKV